MDSTTFCLARGASARKNKPLPQIVGSSYAQGSGSSLTVSRPAGTQPGDLLLGFLTNVAPGNTSSGTGWTNGVFAASGTGMKIVHRVAASGDPSNFSIAGGNSSAKGMVLIAVRGAAVDSFAPVVQTSGAMGTTITLASMSASRKNSLLLSFFSIIGFTANWHPDVGSTDPVFEDWDGTTPGCSIFADAVQPGSPLAKRAVGDTWLSVNKVACGILLRPA